MAYVIFLALTCVMGAPRAAAPGEVEERAGNPPSRPDYNANVVEVLDPNADLTPLPGILWNEIEGTESVFGGCLPQGGTDRSFALPNAGRGNIYSVNQSEVMTSFSTLLEICASDVTLWFYVYRSTGALYPYNPYEKIVEQTRFFPGPNSFGW